MNSTGNAQTPLDTPGIRTLVHANSPQLIVRRPGVDNARSHEAQIKVGARRISRNGSRRSGPWATGCGLGQ